MIHQVPVRYRHRPGPHVAPRRDEHRRCFTALVFAGAERTHSARRSRVPRQALTPRDRCEVTGTWWDRLPQRLAQKRATRRLGMLYRHLPISGACGQRLQFAVRREFPPRWAGPHHAPPPGTPPETHPRETEALCRCNPCRPPDMPPRTTPLRREVDEQHPPPAEAATMVEQESPRRP